MDKDLRRIQKTGSEAARRVLLGSLLFELVAIEKAMFRNGCTADELRRWQALYGNASEMQEQLSSPDLPGVPPANLGERLRRGVRTPAGTGASAKEGLKPDRGAGEASNGKP